MTEQDVDDVTFLTGTNHRVTSSINHPICQSSPLIHDPRDSGGVVGNESNSGPLKKSLYENHGVATCSHNRALCIATIVFVLLSALAIFIAFTSPDCTCAGEQLASIEDEAANTTKTFVPHATNGQIFPWNNIRLPTSLKPYRYNITIHPNLTTLEVRSQVSIEFQAQNHTNFIVLHFKNMTILDKMVQDQFGNNLTITKLLEYPGAQQIYIETREYFDRRKNYTLKIRYNFKLNDKTEGFYLTSYKNNVGERRYLAATQFKPTYARTAFPCFDEPHFKAKFRLTIFRDRFHLSLFNTPIVNTDDLGFYMGTGLLRDDFLETKEMSTYLVAFVVCDFFQAHEQSKTGVPVSVYSFSQNSYLLNIANHLLNYYENLFGVSYPFPKLDLVALPKLDEGAMENWGLVTYRETASTDVFNETSVSTRQWFLSAIAHALAYQWFGNLVTMKWWNDLWLFESFATYFQYLGVNDCFAEWKMMEQFLIDRVQPALALDALASSHSISTAVNDPEIDDIFDTITLDKGIAIVQMLANFLSEENLQSGLSDFLLSYKYNNAEAEDLWNTFSKNTNETLDVKGIVDTWIQQMGYPLITLKRNKTEIIASQTRFLVTAEYLNISTYSSTKSPYDYKWYIPLNYFSDNDSETKLIWMNMTDVRFELSPDIKWIKANVNQKGFYRILYDEEMWNTLISVLKGNHKTFSAADRSGLLDDAFSLCRAGLINSSVPLEMSLYLINEKDYAPWATAIQHLTSWARRLSESLAYKSFLKYMRYILTPIIKYVTWNKSKSHTDTLLRVQVLSAAILCELNDTIADAKVQYQNWMFNNKPIDPNLKEVIYSAGIKYGGMNEWQYCWNYYKNTTDSSEKKILLKAMGVASDPWLLQRYLMETLDKNVINPEDIKLVLEVVAANPEGRLLAWRHLKAYWRNMHNLYGNSSILMGNLISAVTAHLSTQYDFYEVSTYFNGMNVGAASKFLNRSLEIIQLNIHWLNKNEEAVNNWLRKTIK